MKITRTGKIVEGFYALGHASVPVYLLDGPAPVLFDAGFTGLSGKYVDDIREILGSKNPEFLFLTHAHWDHVGAAGMFKKTWPNLKIAAAEEAARLLARPKVRQTITALNRDALDALRKWGVAPLNEAPFTPFGIDLFIPRDRPLRPSPDLSVVGIFTPGHTRDFVAYWIPERQILIASEAAGCDQVPEFLINYDAYMAGLDLFLRLDVQVLCVGHHLVVAGKDVRPYLRELQGIAENYCACVEDLLKKGEDIKNIVARVKKKEWDVKGYPKQPEQAYLMNTKVRVQTLKNRIKKAYPRNEDM